MSEAPRRTARRRTARNVMRRLRSLPRTSYIASRLPAPPNTPTMGVSLLEFVHVAPRGLTREDTHRQTYPTPHPPRTLTPAKFRRRRSLSPAGVARIPTVARHRACALRLGVIVKQVASHSESNDLLTSLSMVTASAHETRRRRKGSEIIGCTMA
jgi:hypothetical protein